MAGVISRVVTRVSARPASTSSLFTPSGFSYDYAIGGLPFLSNASRETPMARKTAPYRKDQIDQTPVPGEQSMVFWWLRSQISFHGGAGIIFEEPALDPTILYSDPLAAAGIPVRYQDGEGIDVWSKPGHVSLLPTTTQNKAATGSVLLEGAIDGITDIYLQAEGNALARCVDGSNTSVTWGGTGTILSLTNDGTNYYAADATGIYKGTLAGGAGALAWNTGSSPVIIKWAKDRLVAAIGGSVYELAGGTPPALPTALFTPQSPTTFTAIEEGPDCIFLSGNVGGIGKVWAITLGQDSGNVPILQTPVEVAMLPAGELVYSLKVCEGSYLAIGTNKGLRIADIGSHGSLQWGPLQFTTTAPIRSIATWDRFIYCGFEGQMADGTSGLLRLDLGTQVQFQRFAYGKDLRAHVSGQVNSAVMFGASGRLVFSVDGHGSYLQHSTQLESSGYLQTGNIRFHTQEPKLFKYVNLQTSPLTHGSIGVSVTDSDGGVNSIVTFGSNSDTTADVAFPVSLGTQGWINLTFTLTRDSVDATQGPTLYSYQVKALPGQKNQRNIMVPIKLFDHEVDKYGNAIGYEGYAWDRLTALESLEENRDNIQFQDLTRKGQATILVVIDDITFQQTDPPANMSGFGGIAMVTLRTVT